MLPITEGSYDCWHFIHTELAQFSPFPFREEFDAATEGVSRKFASLPGKLVPRATKKLECDAEITSLMERVLLHITDFFSTSVSLLTKKNAIENDLKNMLNFPHKVKQGNWSKLFDKRCAEAKWYGVDMDTLMHEAFVGMGRQATSELKKLIMEDEEHGWLKNAFQERDKKEAEAISKIGKAIDQNNMASSGEIDAAILEAIGFGCNPDVILDKIIENMPANAQKILRICSAGKNSRSALLKMLSEKTCLSLNSDSGLFARVIEEMDEKDVNVFFQGLNEYSDPGFLQTIQINHLTWIAGKRLDTLVDPGHAGDGYPELEGMIKSARFDEVTIRKIFSNAARNFWRLRPMSELREGHVSSKYDRWLKEAQRVSAMQDDELEAALSNPHDDDTSEVGLSPDRYAVLRAEAELRAEFAHADIVASLKQTLANAALLDSVALLLPGTLVANEHAIRQQRFEKMGNFVVEKDLGRVFDGLFFPDQQRFLQCFEYLAKHLKNHRKPMAGNFLASSLKQMPEIAHGNKLKDGDRRMLSEMLGRHFQGKQPQTQGYTFQKFTDSQRDDFQKSLASQFGTLASLNGNVSADEEKPFCQQFVKDNRSFHVWINDQPMDGFSTRTDLQRSELIAEALISDIKATRDQVFTVSRICVQDVANEFFTRMRSHQILVLDKDDAHRFGIHSTLTNLALAPMEWSVEQIIKKGRNGIVEVKYFMHNDRLSKLQIEGGALYLDREKSSFHAEIAFAVQPNGDFEITGDIRVGLKIKILGAEQ